MRGTSFEREHGLPLDLLSRLSGALGGADPAGAVRGIFAQSDLEAPTVDAFVEGALLLSARVEERRLRASRCEIELSLGVLLVLTGLLHGARAERAQ